MPTRLSPADAAWLHMDRPTNLMVITAALWFDEPLDEAELRLVIFERLVDRYPRFRQRIADGLRGPSWAEADDFDLDMHVHHGALPRPGDRASLERAVSDLMSQPLDRALPLWSVHLLDGYGDGCALLIRMHHAIADGIALARVMLDLTDLPGASAPHFAPPDGGRRFAPARALLGAAGALAHEATESLLHPSHVAQLAREGLADAGALAGFLTARRERTHVLHDRLGVGERAAWSQAIPLDAVKDIAHAHGATVNDVLIASVAGGLAAYFDRYDQPVRDVHAMVPFNLRPLDQPLPRDLGNRFGLVLLDLPVAADGPLERLQEASRRMREIKHSRQGVVSYGILGAMGRTPALVEARVVDLFSSKATMVLTNVPGPREPVHLGGTRVAGVLVWAPCSGAVGLSVSIFSYAGEVTVGFMADRRLLQDVRVLVEMFELAAQELLGLSAARA